MLPSLIFLSVQTVGICMTSHYGNFCPTCFFAPITTPFINLSWPAFKIIPGLDCPFFLKDGRLLAANFGLLRSLREWPPNGLRRINIDFVSHNRISKALRSFPSHVQVKKGPRKKLPLTVTQEQLLLVFLNMSDGAAGKSTQNSQGNDKKSLRGLICSTRGGGN